MKDAQNGWIKHKLYIVPYKSIHTPWTFIVWNMKTKIFRIFFWEFYDIPTYSSGKTFCLFSQISKNCVACLYLASFNVLCLIFLTRLFPYYPEHTTHRWKYNDGSIPLWGCFSTGIRELGGVKRKMDGAKYGAIMEPGRGWKKAKIQIDCSNTWKHLDVLYPVWLSLRYFAARRGQTGNSLDVQSW